MQVRRASVFTLVLAGGCLQSFQVNAQHTPEASRSRQKSGVDIRLQKFRPVRSPDAIAVDASGAMIRSEAVIGLTAAQQINALLRDKQARTPAQRKISSKLIYTARMLQGLPAAPEVPSLRTGVDVDDVGNVLVDISADVTESFLAQLKDQGASLYGSYPAYHSVRALVPASHLETIAGWANVVFIRPKQEAMTSRYWPPTLPNAGIDETAFAGRSTRVSNYLKSVLPLAQAVRKSASARSSLTPTGQGSQTSEGDLTHRVFDARMAFGVNGSGVKIGVLSDGASSLAQSQALGDLPEDLTVLPGQIGGGDEGTAMMEIVHDLAPGAKLYFATAFGGIASFAQNIQDLRAAGCDIIIDDVFYFDENPFVDGQSGAVVSPSNGGLILQAVNDATAAGTLYFSSAGNEGNLDDRSAGAYESDFVDGGSLGLLAGGTVHLFGTTPYDSISADGGNDVMLFWSDPLGASNNDYDLFVLNSTGTAVLEASTDVQDGTQDPTESLSPAYNVTNNRLVVFKHTGAQNRYFHLNTFRGELAMASAGETHGHSHSALAFSVAATAALGAWSPASPDGPYPNPFVASNQIERFSSDGPRHLFYHADGTAITPGDVSSTGGTVRQKPDITAADGVSVTGVGGFGSPFYGTSAAAPHAGAIAALVKSASPNITSDEMRTALTGSAVDIMGPGVDRDSGAGIVMAFEALRSLGVNGSANPELGTIAATDHPGNGNGMLEAGEGGIVTIELKNTGGVVDATAIRATLTSITPGVVISLPNVSVYADLPKLTGDGKNLSPLTFTLDSDYRCGLAIDFVLSVAYNGGPSPRVLRFAVPTGPMFNVSTGVGASGPIATIAGVATATGTQSGRVLRNGVATTCATTPKAWPGVIGTSSRQYDSYTFTATHDFCTTLTLTSINGANLFLDAYSPSFAPSDISTSYYADSGGSGTVQSFSMAVAADQQYMVTVHDVPAGAASGSIYDLQFSGCAFSSRTPNRLPVAQTHDVNLVAGSDHTASASVDNGSYDPDPGDTITVTQSPVGPYSVGATPVVLTVIDSQGAAAQANATVTVVEADFDFGGLELPSQVVVAGESSLQAIRIRPNPAPWNAVVTFACAGLPALTTCAFNPARVTPGGSDASTALTITTTGANTGGEGGSGTPLAIWLGLSGLTLVVAGSFRQRRSSKMRAFEMLAQGMLSLASLALVGCGSGPITGVQRGTPAGTYTITVTAKSGSVNHAASFQFTVN